MEATKRQWQLRVESAWRTSLASSGRVVDNSSFSIPLAPRAAKNGMFN